MPTANLHTDVLENDLHSRLQNPDASFMLALWQLARGAGDMPAEAQLPVKQIERLRPQLMVLRPAGPGDWSYEHYGEEIARQAGFDMTGRRVSDFQGPVGDFFRRLYRRVTVERRALGSVHRFSADKASPLWERLILPVGEDEVAALYVINKVREPSLGDNRAERMAVLAA